MARDLFSNQGSTTVSSGGTTGPPSQGATESWTVASSSTFPAASNAASPPTQFYVSDPAAPSETILVTNVSGATWSVTRGADGTTPVLHTAGFTVRNVVTSAWLQEVEDRVKNCFSVLEYAADPTGVADSSTAFQACATAAQTYAASYGRANMLIPAGSYKLNSTFKIVGGNVTITAYGAYIFAGSNQDLFRDWTSQDSSYTLNGSGLQIYGGTWDLKGQNWGLSSNATLNATGFSAFTLSNSSNIVLKDITVRNVYTYHGFDINTVNGVMIENCRLEGFQNNFNWHTDVRLASTANVASLSGNVSIDSVTTAPGDRVLLKNQTTTTQNGIYVTAAGAWSRAADMDAAGEADRAAVSVTAGTVNTGLSYYQSAVNPTPGSAAMTWAATTGFNTQSRYFSEAIQLDDGPNDIPCKNITVSNCYMGPATDGSGLLSFGKMVGSHTDSTNGLYTNIKVLGCTSEASLSNAIQGYSWADATIANNTILGSSERGIRMTFNASNVGPRLSITGNMLSNTVSHGIEVDGNTGTFGDINISNNVITSSVMVTPGVGIRVNVIDRVTVANNSIKLTGSPSAQQGIYLLTVNGGVVSGNGIYDAGTFGIQTTTVTRASLTGNHIYGAGSDGIYLTAGTSKTICSGNSIVGCSRTTNATYSGITVSNNALNVDNSIIGNKFNKFGSGNEMLTPIEIEGTNPTDTYIIGNTFGGDWGGPGLGNYTWNNNASVNLADAEFSAAATATTAVGTSITAITGLSLTNIPAGTWTFRMWVPMVVVGTPTAFTATVSPSGAPTTTACRYNVRRLDATTAWLDSYLTAFNSASATSALSAQTYTFEIEGTFVSSNTGTLSLSMTRTGGTSATTQIGSYMTLSRQA